MIRDEIIIARLIYDLYKEKKIDELEMFLDRLKNSGRFNLLRRVIFLLKDMSDEQDDIIRGEIESAFEKENWSALEKFMQKKIEIVDKKINSNLILGAIFRTKNFEIDFSLKGLFKRWMI
ncbi:MAG: F0F1 ATP synthase subunit delta [Patescibacteria group bacterium]|nr:F0F1 ATP synthase subunit delta [Patescibacteria group bacterium]